MFSELKLCDKSKVCLKFQVTDTLKRKELHKALTYMMKRMSIVLLNIVASSQTKIGCLILNTFLNFVTESDVGE